jgi:hypothetical protein
VERGNVDAKTFHYLTLAGGRFAYVTLGRALVIKVISIIFVVYVLNVAIFF